MSWGIEPDPAVVQGGHPIALRVAQAYRELRGKIVADDWSGVITAYLEKHDAARVRGDGRVYWVPPRRLPDIKKLGDFLTEVGIDLVLCEIEAESRTVVEAVAQESLDEQISGLEAEAQEFDGTQKPSTYSRRLEEYQRLRERAVLYRDALGVGVDRAEQVLAELEQKVSSMLDLRRQTVVERVVSKVANPLNLEAVELEDAAKDLYDQWPQPDHPQLTQTLEPILRQLSDIHTRLEQRIASVPERRSFRARQALTKVETYHRALSQLALRSLSKLHMAPGAA